MINFNEIYFNELFASICNRTPSIPVRRLPFLDHFNIGSGQASAKQLSKSNEPLTSRCVTRGSLIVNVGCANHNEKQKHIYNRQQH